KGVHPAPTPCKVQFRFPKPIQALLRSSAALFWIDREASANKLRQLVEVLLTHQKVPQKGLTAKRKMRPLTLHDRIIRYRERNAELADMLLAIKVLGNDGSHPGNVEEIDLLQSFDIVDYVLNEVYYQHTAQLKAAAKRISRGKRKL